MIFDRLTEILKSNSRKVAFPEGMDLRVVEAAVKLKEMGALAPILLGNQEEVQKNAADNGFNLDGIEIMDPKNYPDMENMVQSMVEIRKGKNTEEECRELLQGENYFGIMLVKLGLVDALVGGAVYSTADLMRPALQIIKTKPSYSSVSSCSLIIRPNSDGSEECYILADCAITVDPSAENLAEIALGSIETAEALGIEPRVAFLSYSTNGSAKGDSVDKMRKACELVKSMKPNTAIDGELQFDAAVSEDVSKAKFPESKLEGKANTFIFPDINASNIGLKIAQEWANFSVYGPIIIGLNAPVNDLSRGCSTDEIVKTAIITAALI